MGMGVKLGIMALAGNAFSNVYSLNFDGNDDFVDLGNIKPAGAMSISYWFIFSSYINN